MHGEADSCVGAPAFNQAYEAIGNFYRLIRGNENKTVRFQDEGFSVSEFIKLAQLGSLPKAGLAQSLQTARNRYFEPIDFLQSCEAASKSQIDRRFTPLALFDRWIENYVF